MYKKTYINDEDISRKQEKHERKYKKMNFLNLYLWVFLTCFVDESKMDMSQIIQRRFTKWMLLWSFFTYGEVGNYRSV